MKGILINPFDHTVKEVDILGNLEDCYLLMNCSTVDAIQFDDDNTLWVDDDRDEILDILAEEMLEERMI